MRCVAIGSRRRLTKRWSRRRVESSNAAAQRWSLGAQFRRSETTLADAITTTVLSYVGAVTGIVGSILGYLGYRQSRQIKSLDLRLELRKSVSDLRATVEELPGLLQRARESRAAINAARGIL